MALTAKTIIQAFEESGITTKRQLKRVLRQLTPLAEEELSRKVERLYARKEQLEATLAEIESELEELDPL